MEFTATDYGEGFEAGTTHPVILKDIKQLESQFEDSEYFLAWEFEVTEGDFAGREISGSSSTNFGPQAKGREWAEALLGRKLSTGEKIAADKLIGQGANVLVDLKEKERGTFPQVSKVYPLRKGQKAGEQATSKDTKKAPKGKSKTEAEEAEESFDEIPF